MINKQQKWTDDTIELIAESHLASTLQETLENFQNSFKFIHESPQYSWIYKTKNWSYHFEQIPEFVAYRKAYRIALDKFEMEEIKICVGIGLNQFFPDYISLGNNYTFIEK